MPNICQQYAKGFNKYDKFMSTNNPKIWHRYGHDMPKICPRYALDMPNIYA